uniref:Rhodanese domain-containing protein n=1 Tax=Trichobilharzia regenti TaxID=157069 RepID=A0AA85K6M2_TRIRE|nr:unnamed protein product [Trichobilharzia regenti]
MFSFGNYPKDKLMNKGVLSSDTPVTRLSKILSEANFLDTSKKTELKLSQISKIVPADIDESANQEPPTASSWPETQEFLVREGSNSCSSGYYSNATTHSAPASCICERVCETNAFENDQPVSTIESAYCFSEYLTPAESKLRRAHSCSSRGWLAKRQRRQQWPRISGICKVKGASNSSILNVDTNSCPAVISHDNQSMMRRYSLPPVGEVGSSGTSDDSPVKSNIMSFLSSKSPSPRKQVDLSNSSVCPVIKKQRFDSPTKSNLDVTLPSEDVNDVSDHEIAGNLFPNSNHMPRPFFDLLRHHSTPMPSSYSYKPCPRSPVEVIAEGDLHKPVMSKCVSELPSISYDRIAKCIGSLSSHSLCSDGRRSRALRVVDRTGSGLHCVSTETVADLVSGNNKRNVNFVIVDCRFPYEYEGGHIKGAINIFTHSDLVQEIFNRVPAQRPPGTSGPPRYLGQELGRRLAVTQREPLSAPCELLSDDEDDLEIFGNTTSDVSDSDLPCADDNGITETNLLGDSSKSEPDLSYISSSTANSGDSNTQDPPFVVIFHCEFSSQRAPALAAFLRSVDRVSNYHRYPFLYFPEIYVMKGGYSAFYKKFSHLCTPQEYVKMFHRDHRNDLRLYKRLTRRVSSACLACIKPQPNENKKPDIPLCEVDSFCQLPRLKKPDDIPLQLQFPSKHAFHIGDESDVSCNMQVENKENCVPADVCSHSQNTSTHSSSNEKPDVTSPSVAPCSSERLSSSMVDSPLGLAEVVVRVGRRVIAATLGGAGAKSTEVARVLNQVKQPESVQPVNVVQRRPQARFALKRALTTSALDTPCQMLRPSDHNPFCDGGSYLQNTPAIRKARPNNDTFDLAAMATDNNNNSCLTISNSSVDSNHNIEVQSSPEKGLLSYHSLSTYNKEM